MSYNISMSKARGMTKETICCYMPEVFYWQRGIGVMPG